MAALPNIRTATEWQALLSQCGFSEIEVVAEFPGRRLWYPAVLTLKATKQHS